MNGKILHYLWVLGNNVGIGNRETRPFNEGDSDILSQIVLKPRTEYVRVEWYALAG
jgi:hypothetical protein